MSEYAWTMLAYFALQGASLAFLPRWWKLAAVPALLLVPEIISGRGKSWLYERCHRRDGYHLYLCLSRARVAGLRNDEARPALPWAPATILAKRHRDQRSS